MNIVQKTSLMNKNYKEYLQQITTLIFDVDGVLTDGSITVTSNGDLYRTMHTKDGYALKTSIDLGFHVCIISGGSNEGVRKRLQGLGIKDIFLGTHQKVKVLEEYLAKNNIKKSQVLYMGDDIPDYKVMKMVALPCAPQDAVPEIKEIAKYVSHKKGGKGCVREIIEQVLKVQGKWLQTVDAKYD